MLYLGLKFHESSSKELFFYVRSKIAKNEKTSSVTLFFNLKLCFWISSMLLYYTLTLNTRIFFILDGMPHWETRNSLRPGISRDVFWADRFKYIIVCFFFFLTHNHIIVCDYFVPPKEIEGPKSAAFRIFPFTILIIKFLIYSKSFCVWSKRLKCIIIIYMGLLLICYINITLYILLIIYNIIILICTSKQFLTTILKILSYEYRCRRFLSIMFN